MKKILLISLLILGLTGCSNNLAKLKNNDTIKYNINTGFIQDEVLTNIKEGTDVETKLDEENSKLIITLTNGDTTQTLEQAVEIEYPLATLSDETLDINAYNFDPNKILNDLKEGTDVKYELKDNEVVITLSKGEQVDTIKRSANISYPLAWFNDDITIDTYYGYKIEELINLSEGTTITSDDLTDDVLSATVSNGDKKETIETKVNLTSSVRKYEYYSEPCGDEGAFYGTTWIYPDGKMHIETNRSSWNYTLEGPIEVGSIIHGPVFNNPIIEANEDGSWFKVKDTAQCMNGKFTNEIYTEIK